MNRIYTENDLQIAFRRGFAAMDLGILKMVNPHAYERHFIISNEEIEDHVQRGLTDPDENHNWGKVWFTTSLCDDTDRKRAMDRIVKTILADNIQTSFVCKKISRDISGKKYREELIYDVRDTEGDNADPIGYVLSRGVIKPVWQFMLIIEPKGSEFRHKITTLPFEISSLYPISEDQLQ